MGCKGCTEGELNGIEAPVVTMPLLGHGEGASILAGDVKAAGTPPAGIGAAPVLANAASAPIVAVAVLPVVSPASTAAAMVPSNSGMASMGVNAATVIPVLEPAGTNVATVAPSTVFAPIVQPGIESARIKTAAVVPGIESPRIIAPTIRPLTESASINAAGVVPTMESARIVAPTFHPGMESGGINRATVVPAVASGGINAATVVPGMESARLGPASALPVRQRSGSTPTGYEMSHDARVVDGATRSLKGMQSPIAQPPLLPGDGATSVGATRIDEAHFVPETLSARIVSPTALRGIASPGINAAATVVSGSIDPASFACQCPPEMSGGLHEIQARAETARVIDLRAPASPILARGSDEPAMPSNASPVRVDLSGSPLLQSPIGARPFPSPRAATVSRVGGLLTLTNGLIELVWSLGTGALLSFSDVVSGRRFLSGGPESSNWSLWVDSSSDMWAPAERAYGLGQRYDGRGMTLSRNWWSCDGNGTCIVHLEWINVGNTYVDVTQHIRLGAGDQVSHWTTTVHNSGTGTVTALLSPHIAGLNALENESLMWPEHEGKIFANPGWDKRLMQYPVPLSMQWIHLFNEQQGLYFAVLDATARYKEFRFGYDPDIDAYGGNIGRAISVTNWPFATHGQTWTSAQTELGIMTNGGWFPGADRYRSWLVNQSGWATPRQPLARSLVSYRTAVIKRWNGIFDPPDSCKHFISGSWNIHHNYTDIAKLLLAPVVQTSDSSSGPAYGSLVDGGASVAELNNWSQVALFGWHIDGFDTRYPDFQFFDSPGDIGTRDDLRLQVDVLRLFGKNVTFYENLHAADKQSRWFNALPPGGGCWGIGCQTQGEIGSIKKAAGNTYVEHYCLTAPPGFLPDFVAMCPSYRPWQDQLVARAQALHDIGGQGFWFDQVEEKEARLCYDNRHGHSSPATAFSEGYASLLPRMQALMADRPYFFIAEGINDYYSKYIDIAGGSFMRPFGYKPEHAPEVARYTIPTRILGSITYLPLIDGRTASLNGRAFLMALPIASGEDTMPRGASVFLKSPEADQTNTVCPAVPRMPDIYQFRPEIYLDGRYDADKAVRADDPNLRVSTLTAANGTFAVQLVNEKTMPLTGMVHVDLGKLGFGGRVVASVKRLDSNRQFCNTCSSARPCYKSLNFTRTGNVLSFSEPSYAAGDVRSYVVTLGGGPPSQ